MAAVTTRLATISSPSVIRLLAIRHASASHRRRSRMYRTNPAMMPTIPAGTSSQRYCIVVAMNAPLPSPSTITVRGRRQHSEARAAPTQATTPAASAASLMGFLLRLRRERTVLEGQPVRLATASNGVARLCIIWQGDDLIAGRTTHPVSERGGPSAHVFTNPERVAGAVRALQQVARLGTVRQLYEGATVRAGYRRHQRTPRSRCNRPRS